jgi:hypothetical protein
VRALALAAAALALAGCGTVSDEAAAPRAPAPPERVGSAGVSVELPPGWYATKANDGNVTDPLARVVVASSPIHAAASECQTFAYAFADDAVVLVLVEWWGPAMTPGAKHPPRPARFTPAGLDIRPGSHECYAGRSGAVFFEDGGRTFGAYVFLGARAPDSLVDALCTVLDSLAVTPARART